MSKATAALQMAMLEYKESVTRFGELRTLRDNSKRELKESEQVLFAGKIQDGTIDGKSAEVRDAQAQIQYRNSAQWGMLSTLSRSSEERFLQSQDRVTLALAELRVQAILVNAEIAETGSTKLFAEVNLAGI